MAWIRQFLKKLSWFIIQTERSISSVYNFMRKAKLKTCISSVINLEIWYESVKLRKKQNLICQIKKIKKNKGDKFQVFTVEIYLFNLNIPSLTFHLQYTPPSLDEHVVLIGRSSIYCNIAEFLINKPDAMQFGFELWFEYISCWFWTSSKQWYIAAVCHYRTDIWRWFNQRHDD